MKKKLVLVFVLLFIPLIFAQLSSTNYGISGSAVTSGGNASSTNYKTSMVLDNIIGSVSSSSYSQSIGFFFSFCGDGICNSLEEDCSSCAADCGCSSGYTCTGGTCVADEVPVTGDSGGDGGDGGGGEGVSLGIVLNQTEININLAINTNKEYFITVTNLGTSARSVSVSQQNLDNMVMFEETSFELGPGESRQLKIVFVALSQTGIFTGKIFIGGRQVLVSLNIRTKLLLFDSNIVVLNPDYLVEQGDDLKTKVTLIPMGDKDRLDVTLNYVIKDYNGKTYLTKSETLLVEEQMDFKRDFDTGKLPIDTYVVGLELVYPGGVATSSAHFEVIERTSVFKGRVYLYLIIAILTVLILIVILLLIREIQKRRAQRVSGSSE